MLRPVPVTLAVLMCAACAEPVGRGSDRDAGEEPGQGEAAASALVVNEIAPDPGSEDDWIELYNRGDEPLDLCSYFLTDSLERLDHYLGLAGTLPPDPCEPSWIAPGTYLRIWADDSPELGVGHAPFKLGRDDGVHLVDNQGQVVDSLLYLYSHDAHASLARLPDGDGLFFTAMPSPEAPNLERAP